MSFAERQGSATGYRQHRFDFKIDVLIVTTLSTRSGLPVGSTRLLAIGCWNDDECGFTAASLPMIAAAN
tara:strand:+ start:734 stop:940 length:207 start_codon:yes stop_codon:yes gene_type:complete